MKFDSVPSGWVVNFRHNLVALGLFEVLNFLLVSVERKGLLLLVELRSVNLLISFSWTQEVLNKIHVSSI